MLSSVNIGRHRLKYGSRVHMGGRLFTVSYTCRKTSYDNYVIAGKAGSKVEILGHRNDLCHRSNRQIGLVLQGMVHTLQKPSLTPERRQSPQCRRMILQLMRHRVFSLGASGIGN